MNKKKKEFIIGYGMSILLFILFPLIGLLAGLFVTFILKERHGK